MPAAASRKAKLGVDGLGVSIQGALRPRVGGGQRLAIGAVSAPSAVLTSAQIVRLVSTVDCHINFGEFATVAALATDMFLTAKMPEYFSVDGYSYIAVIQDVGGGFLFINIME
jgi:hypothetical protein